jgi:hypothetical protein
MAGRISRFADRAWIAFRRWPTWAQVVGWVLGYRILIPILLWRSTLPVAAKIAGTAVASVVVKTGTPRSPLGPPPR